MRLLILALGVLTFSGCLGLGRKAATVAEARGAHIATEAAADVSTKDMGDRLNAAYDRLNVAEASAAQARAEINVEKNRASEERTQGELRFLYWVGLLLIAGALIGAGAAVWLKSWTLASAAAACLAAFAVARLTAMALEHVSALAGAAVALVLAVVGAIIYHTHIRDVGMKGAIRVAEALKPVQEFATEKAARIATQIEAAGPAAAIIDKFRARMGLIAPPRVAPPAPPAPPMPPIL